MLEHLDYNKDSLDERKKITLALIDLFKEIDVNGDGIFYFYNVFFLLHKQLKYINNFQGTMEWEEFSNHIIELGLLRNDRSFKNVIK